LALIYTITDAKISSVATTAAVVFEIATIWKVYTKATIWQRGE